MADYDDEGFDTDSTGIGSGGENPDGASQSKTEKVVDEMSESSAGSSSSGSSGSSSSGSSSQSSKHSKEESSSTSEGQLLLLKEERERRAKQRAEQEKTEADQKDKEDEQKRKEQEANEKAEQEQRERDRQQKEAEEAEKKAKAKQKEAKEAEKKRQEEKEQEDKRRRDQEAQQHKEQQQKQKVEEADPKDAQVNNTPTTTTIVKKVRVTDDVQVEEVEEPDTTVSSVHSQQNQSQYTLRSSHTQQQGGRAGQSDEDDEPQPSPPATQPPLIRRGSVDFQSINSLPQQAYVSMQHQLEADGNNSTVQAQPTDIHLQGQTVQPQVHQHSHQSGVDHLPTIPYEYQGLGGCATTSHKYDKLRGSTSSPTQPHHEATGTQMIPNTLPDDLAGPTQIWNNLMGIRNNLHQQQMPSWQPDMATGRSIEAEYQSAFDEGITAHSTVPLPRTMKKATDDKQKALLSLVLQLYTNQQKQKERMVTAPDGRIFQHVPVTPGMNLPMSDDPPSSSRTAIHQQQHVIGKAQQRVQPSSVAQDLIGSVIQTLDIHNPPHNHHHNALNQSSRGNGLIDSVIQTLAADGCNATTSRRSGLPFNNQGSHCTDHNSSTTSFSSLDDNNTEMAHGRLQSLVSEDLEKYVLQHYRATNSHHVSGKQGSLGRTRAVIVDLAHSLHCILKREASNKYLSCTYVVQLSHPNAQQYRAFLTTSQPVMHCLPLEEIQGHVNINSADVLIAGGLNNNHSQQQPQHSQTTNYKITSWVTVAHIVEILLCLSHALHELSAIECWDNPIMPMTADNNNRIDTSFKDVDFSVESNTHLFKLIALPNSTLRGANAKHKEKAKQHHHQMTDVESSLLPRRFNDKMRQSLQNQYVQQFGCAVPSSILDMVLKQTVCESTASSFFCCPRYPKCLKMR